MQPWLMTRFIDVPAMSQLAHEIGVDVFIGELANQIEENFKRWEDFDKTARIGAHNEVGVIELMPVADSEGYGFKYVNGHPDNPANNNLPTVMAFGALATMKDGYPLLLSELTVATAMRTAATSLMAARALENLSSLIAGSSFLLLLESLPSSSTACNAKIACNVALL